MKELIQFWIEKIARSATVKKEFPDLLKDLVSIRTFLIVLQSENEAMRTEGPERIFAIERAHKIVAEHQPDDPNTDSFIIAKQFLRALPGNMTASEYQSAILEKRKETGLN